MRAIGRYNHLACGKCVIALYGLQYSTYHVMSQQYDIKALML